jgi:predicted HicB family RNase H-like nuclease
MSETETKSDEIKAIGARIPMGLYAAVRLAAARRLMSLNEYIIVSLENQAKADAEHSDAPQR